MDRVRENLSLTVNVLRQVFSRARYVSLSFIVFITALALAIWLPNLSLIAQIAGSSKYTLKQKAVFLVNSLGALKTNFSLLSAVLTVITIILLAVNASLFVFYIKHRPKIGKEAAAGLSGALSGFLGVGCASCGSVILSSLFSIGFASWFVAALPLGGQEFNLLGSGMLASSIFLTAKKINNPSICFVKRQTRR